MPHSSRASLLILGFLFILFAGGNVLYGQNLQVIKEPGVDRLHRFYLQVQEEQDGLEGYRVQIYNGSKEACRRQRSKFLRYYPDWTAHTVYESPEYRVQVGDFRTRLEAQRFLNQIKDRFKGSFVVKTIIEYPTLNSSN